MKSSQPACLPACLRAAAAAYPATALPRPAHLSGSWGCWARGSGSAPGWRRLRQGMGGAAPGRGKAEDPPLPLGSAACPLHGRASRKTEGGPASQPLNINGADGGMRAEDGGAPVSRDGPAGAPSGLNGTLGAGLALPLGLLEAGGAKACKCVCVCVYLCGAGRAQGTPPPPPPLRSHWANGSGSAPCEVLKAAD